MKSLVAAETIRPGTPFPDEEKRVETYSAYLSEPLAMRIGGHGDRLWRVSDSLTCYDDSARRGKGRFSAVMVRTAGRQDQKAPVRFR